MMLPLELPLSNDELKFEVYDYDLTGDDLVCAMKFFIKDILKSDSSRNPMGPDGKTPQITYTMKWVNLYGCNKEWCGGMTQLTNDKAQMAIQNNDQEEAGAFMGRILVEYHVIDSKHPEMKLKDIKMDDPDFMTRLNKM